MASQHASLSAAAGTITPLILRESLLAPTPKQVLAINAATGDPASVQRYIAQQTNINAALPTQVAVSYQGQVITPIGSLAALALPVADNNEGK